MRTLNSTITNAIANTQGVKISARATLYRNHIYFHADDMDQTHVISLNDGAGIHADFPLLQSCFYYETQDKIVTIYAEGGVIRMSVEGDSTLYTVAQIQALSSCRPCLYNDRIYYYDSSTLQWRYAVLNLTTLFGNPSSDFITSLNNLGGAGHPGAFHAVDSTTLAL